MKTYREFIVEATAVAKAKFKKQFDAVRHSDVFQNTEYKRGGINKWHLTGHNPGAKYGTTKEIEAVKEKVFGKRRKGTSDLLFLHHEHGIVTHPAIGDVTHADVLAHDAPGLGIRSKPRPGIKVNKKIQAKVKEGGIGGIIGQGRIEHHEGGGGIISYSHRGVGSRAAAVRTIARAYPKYQIHDGQGNLLEATATKKKPSLSYAEKFKKLRGVLAKSKDTWARVVSGENRGWSLTGHDTDSTLSNETIRKAKDRVFGKRQGDSHILFFHRHHGIVTHPAIGDLTHQDIHTNAKHLRHHIDQNVRAKVTGAEKAGIIAQGRIEHHKNGGGMISIVGRNHEGDEAPVHPSVIRTLRRAYPKHFIHDGHGNELNENWSYAHDFHEMPNSEKQKYVYHVTTAARAAKIVKGGLKPRSPKGRTNYPSQKEHTQGHAFVTNHHGVGYWVDQTAHAVNRRKREVGERDYENIHVVKFPIANLSKSARRKFNSDDLGTNDSRKHSDYARDPIIDPSTHEAPTAFKVKKKIR